MSKALHPTVHCKIAQLNRKVSAVPYNLEMHENFVFARGLFRVHSSEQYGLKDSEIKFNFFKQVNVRFDS